MKLNYNLGNLGPENQNLSLGLAPPNKFHRHKHILAIVARELQCEARLHGKRLFRPAVPNTKGSGGGGGGAPLGGNLPSSADPVEIHAHQPCGRPLKPRGGKNGGCGGGCGGGCAGGCGGGCAGRAAAGRA